MPGSNLRKAEVRRLQGDLSADPGSLPNTRPFLNRPLEGDWPYLWLDATYVKVRDNGRIVSVAVIVAVAVNSDGRREVLGMAIGASEAETGSMSAPRSSSPPTWPLAIGPVYLATPR